MTTIVNCPTCGVNVEWRTEKTFRPFCSERCKKIDLGAWATGKYMIINNDLLDSDPQNLGDMK
ncbi:DNA gyrase inhibitor YacG [Candidatus Vallotiella sp. (ex Adelges kitamiensis)]|uniref:DNA gyrase inhibitor YacG n=1 Tax=Candidatus Vallotiella sp. (ex Adelges kitamiensis) TaxID=2864217 RepID=UPI001CE2A0E0|nr:DNA gyrase inhibitor YacG [Candidatus Vallotia sp. (ex Adelges kitamiensis)]